LSNIIEQDHRAVKRRVNAKQGFREFQAARRTIQGYEAIHMLRKGQVRWVSGIDVRRQNQFINKVFEMAACDPGSHPRCASSYRQIESCNATMARTRAVPPRSPPKSQRSNSSSICLDQERP